MLIGGPSVPHADGKEHGRGVYLWAGGTRYEGDWNDGKLHRRWRLGFDKDLAEAITGPGLA